MKSNKSIEDLLNSNTDLDLSLLEQFSEYAPLSKENENKIIELGLKKINKEYSRTDSEAIIIENPRSHFINFKKFTAVAASVLIILGVGFGLTNILKKEDLPLTGVNVSTKERENADTTTQYGEKDNHLNYRSVNDINNQPMYCLSSSGYESSIYTGLSKITNVFKTSSRFVLFGTNGTNELIIETSDNFSNFYCHNDFLICSSGEIKSVIQKNNDTFVIYYIDHQKPGDALCRMEANLSTQKSISYECSAISNSNLTSYSNILEIIEPDDSTVLLIMSDRVIKLDINRLNASENNYDIYKNTIYSTNNKIVSSFLDSNGKFNLITCDGNKLQLITFRNFNKKKSSHVDSSLKINPQNISGISTKVINSKYDFIYKENNSILGYNIQDKKSELIASSDFFAEGFSPDTVLVEDDNYIYYAINENNWRFLIN